MRRFGSTLICAAICGGLIGACSSAGAPELTSGLPAQQSQAEPSASASVLPGLPNLPSMASLTNAARLPVGAPTDVYTRVARGALTCWFGASGPLKGTYIYHAEAEPPSKGGRAEIVVRTRDLTAADPRSLKAFRVGIEAGGEGTKVDVENVTIPEPLASRLRADVDRWAASEEGCGQAPVTGGWAAAPAAANSKAGSAKASGKSGANKATAGSANANVATPAKN